MAHKASIFLGNTLLAEYQNRLDYQLHSQGKQIILTGDFNTAHQEIDLANPKENLKTSGFLPEEHLWIDYYLEHGFVDIWRQFYL